MLLSVPFLFIIALPNKYLVLQPVEEHRVPSEVGDGQLLRVDRLVAGDGALAVRARREQLVVADDVAAAVVGVGLQGVEEHCECFENKISNI